MKAFHRDPGPTFQRPEVEPSLDLGGSHTQDTKHWPVLDQIPLAKWRPFNKARVCVDRGGVLAGNLGTLMKTE